MMKKLLALVSLLVAFARPLWAIEAFVEAETFTSPPGWTVASKEQTKTASALGVLRGDRGPLNAVTVPFVTIKDAGKYRVWVRYLSHAYLLHDPSC